MLDVNVRRLRDSDIKEVCKIIRKDILTENIKDYPKEFIDHLIIDNNEAKIEGRNKEFHAYVLTNEDKIVGVGMIGPYWGSLTESAFFSIFIDPDYKKQGLGRKIIETLESDEFYKRANRVEIPSSITGVNFYRHFGYNFKRSDGVFGNIVDKEGLYRLEKFTNEIPFKDNLYNMRPYIDNEYHNYKEFIYEVKRELYKEYVKKYYGGWKEEEQRKYYEDFINNVKDDTWIIELNGVNIGFYNGKELSNGIYEIGNICIKEEYQNKGIGTQVLKDIIDLHKDQDIQIQYFKDNPVGKLYERLGFIKSGETNTHYQMIKKK
jgi:GNAT superfamily N-acetyltransferase